MIPFDDSKISKAVYSTATEGSNDTSGVDLYRQGVELTLPQHYVFGIAKTRAGYSDENHEIPQQQFGLSNESLRNDLVFDDIPNVNPASFVKAYSSLDPNEYHPYSGLEQQIIQYSGPSSLDGAIEPLTIRSVIKFASTYKYIEAHAIKASIESGNVAINQSGDRIISIFKRSDTNIGSYVFVDAQDQIGNVKIDNLDPNVGDTRKISGFDDTVIKDGVRLNRATMSSEIKDALLRCSPSTDTYIPNGYESTSNGFD